MFTTLFAKASLLDKAIVLSVAAMLSFNVLAFASQVQPAPDFARSGEVAAQQA